jgi:hypothetical protein
LDFGISLFFVRLAKISMKTGNSVIFLEKEKEIERKENDVGYEDY